MPNALGLTCYVIGGSDVGCKEIAVHQRTRPFCTDELEVTPSIAKCCSGRTSTVSQLQVLQKQSDVHCLYM